MLRGGIGNAVLAPISEVLARLVVHVMETASAAKDVLIEQESFRELGGYLEKIVPVLRELQDKNVRDTPPMRVALESLERATKSAQEKIKLCGTRSRLYLLVNCRTLVKEVQDITHEIGRCLSLIPLATINISVDSRETTTKLLAEMQTAEFRAAAADEEVVEKIEIGLKNQRTDSGFVKDLLVQIGKAVGVSPGTLSLKRELEDFKRDKEELEFSKKLQEAYQLEQIIGLLRTADASPVSSNGSSSGYSGRKDTKALLSSFYCPLTGEVMSDPVVIASGQTFERTAIEKWFRDGNEVCPVTLVKLESLDVKPNIALRSSVEEWKEMSTRSIVAAIASKLQSPEENEIEASLRELHKLSEEGSRNRVMIVGAGLVPVLATLLKSKQKFVRTKTLATLCSLAAEDETKEKILDGGTLPYAVKSLARDTEEVEEAVRLLLELSKVPELCDRIGKTQGCVLLLATTLQSDKGPAATEASILLSRLSSNSEHVVQMAEANYFGPLVHRLAEGTSMDRLLMASAIAKMSLTDQGKFSLAHEGAIEPLVKMISLGNLEAKSAALGAVRNMSTLQETTEKMIRAGLVQPLLRLLCSVTSSLVTLKEKAAVTFANLTASNAASPQGNQVLESEETVTQILSLLNLAGPEVQRHLLQALCNISIRDGAFQVRKLLREADGIQLLFPFCESADESVRVPAIKLLLCLSKDGAREEIAEYLGQSSTRKLVDLLVMKSSGEEEKAAVAGIIANLPPSDEQTGKLAEAGLLQAVVNILLQQAKEGEKRYKTPAQDKLLESITGALLHFTRPSRGDMQKAAAGSGAIPCLVEILSTGNSVAKSRAATALGHFSQNTLRLSRKNERTGSRSHRSSCLCGIVPLGSRSRQQACAVHGGRCSVESSFCLVEAGAVQPLVQCLEEEEAGVQTSALVALSTLLVDEIWEKGVEVIAKANGVRAMVRIISVPSSSSDAKEKAVWMLERIFRVERLREEFGGSAQMPLVDLTQRASTTVKSMAARVLAHLGTLHTQSSYF